MVIIGDDHLEWFGHGVTPTFMIYNGTRITNFALTPEEGEQGVGVHNNPIRHAGQLVNRPDEDTDYPLHPELAEHLVRSLMADHIDIAECRQQPVGPGGSVLNLPYAFTLVQRRILGDRLLPMVPVTVNAYFQPILRHNGVLTLKALLEICSADRATERPARRDLVHAPF